tara:strand:- start:626 stop:1696 length:1071 start_codon:yes stop_codon:yes gene_type:complete
MTDYTNITENFGDTICQEFLEKTKEKFKNYPLVPKENECLYWLGDKDLMKGLTQKLNSYFNTINDNEFIVGFIIYTKSKETSCISGPRTNFDYYSYLITNYGNIYIFGYGPKLTEKQLSSGTCIEIPDKIGRYSYYDRVYDIYIRLEKILIINQKLFDSEIDEIKKNISIINYIEANYNELAYRYIVSIEYLYEPHNTINFLVKDNIVIDEIKNSNIEIWKQVVLNHKKIEAHQNIIVSNNLDLQTLRDTIEGLTPGTGPLNPQEQMSLINENDELKKLISQKKSIGPPEHFNCPISTDVMEEPVIAMDGHTYDRASIELWFQNHNTSPMTREIISTNLIPNFNLKSQIDEWYNNN